MVSWRARSAATATLTPCFKPDASRLANVPDDDRPPHRSKPADLYGLCLPPFAREREWGKPAPAPESAVTIPHPSLPSPNLCLWPRPHHRQANRLPLGREYWQRTKESVADNMVSTFLEIHRSANLPSAEITITLDHPRLPPPATREVPSAIELTRCALSDEHQPFLSRGRIRFV